MASWIGSWFSLVQKGRNMRVAFWCLNKVTERFFGGGVVSMEVGGGSWLPNWWNFTQA